MGVDGHGEAAFAAGEGVGGARGMRLLSSAAPCAGPVRRQGPGGKGVLVREPRPRSSPPRRYGSRKRCSRTRLPKGFPRARPAPWASKVSPAPRPVSAPPVHSPAPSARERTARFRRRPARPPVRPRRAAYRRPQAARPATPTPRPARRTAGRAAHGGGTDRTYRADAEKPYVYGNFAVTLRAFLRAGEIDSTGGASGTGVATEAEWVRSPWQGPRGGGPCRPGRRSGAGARRAGVPRSSRVCVLRWRGRRTQG